MKSEKRPGTFLLWLTRSPLGLFGTILAATSGLLIVSLLAWEIASEGSHLYLGVITYLVLPFVFILGLGLVLVGVRRQRKRMTSLVESGGALPGLPVIDLNDDRVRSWLAGAAITGALVAVLLVVVTVEGVEYIESTAFCGSTCHVMEPEHTAWQRSAHSRIGCVECHVGSGARWFLRAKVSGVRQVFRLWTNTYDRPIPTPVHDLRPASATCEHCHWPTKFIGDRTRVITRFRSDSANTELKTILLNHVGGQTLGKSAGIHWHVDPSVEIRYRSDPSRENIREVILTRSDGEQTVWARADAATDPATGEDAVVTGSSRKMDCVDCHNRPTHIYWSQEESVDLALSRGEMSADLPFIRREGLRALGGSYSTHEDAEARIAGEIERFYRDSFPEVATSRAEQVAKAGRILGMLWATNVFPTMKLGWSTYPDHLGHPGFEGGCFRCHGSELTTEGGETIPRDCGLCHKLLAMDTPAAQLRLDTSTTD